MNAPPNEIEPSRSRALQIVLVENDPALLVLFADWLRELGHDVRETADPTEALAWLAQRRDVDVLFTDINIPAMDGRELGARARQFFPGLRIVFATGYSARKLPDLRSDPLVRYLRKPFGPDEVAKALDALQHAAGVPPLKSDGATDGPSA